MHLAGSSRSVTISISGGSHTSVRFRLGLLKLSEHTSPFLDASPTRKAASRGDRSPGGFALADQGVYLVASVWSRNPPLGLGKKPDRAEKRGQHAGLTA